MGRWSRWVIPALSLVAPAAAHGQAPVALPDLPAQCGGASPFGESYGAKKVAGSARRGLGQFAYGSLGAAHAPFREVEIGFGGGSGAIFQVSGTLPAASAAAAEEVAENIRDQFRAAGWVETGVPGAPTQAFDPLGSKGDFNSEEGGLAAAPTGRRASIFVTGRDVTVACADLPAFADHVENVFGPANPGPERPQPPAVIPAGVPLKLDCTRPLDELEAELATSIQNPGDWLSAAKRVNLYFEQIVAWNGKRMIDAGAWTEKDKSDFALSLLGHPELADGWAYYGEAATAVLKNLATVMERYEEDDQPGACKAYNALFAELEGAPQRTMAFTAAVDRIYAAEAAKRGVKLD